MDELRTLNLSRKITVGKWIKMPWCVEQADNFNILERHLGNGNDKNEMSFIPFFFLHHMP